MNKEDLPENVQKQLSAGIALGIDGSPEIIAKHCETAEEFINETGCDWEKAEELIQEKDLDLPWEKKPQKPPKESSNALEQRILEREKQRRDESTSLLTNDDVGMTIDESEIEPYADTSGLYVLRCEDDQYYVGMSKNIKARLRKHFCGRGSQWTQRYHPQEIVEVVEYHVEYETLEKLEDQKTLEMMDKHGWKNVRGGRWWSPFISAQPQPLRDNN